MYDVSGVITPKEACIEVLKLQFVFNHLAIVAKKN